MKNKGIEVIKLCNNVENVLKNKITKWNNKPLIVFCKKVNNDLLVDKIIEVPKQYVDFTGNVFYDEYFKHILVRANKLQYDEVYLVVGYEKKITDKNKKEIINHIKNELEYSKMCSIAVFQNNKFFV